MKHACIATLSDDSFAELHELYQPNTVFTVLINMWLCAFHVFGPTGRYWEPAVLIEGVLFRARYLGSTQLVCEGQPTKSTRMMQAEEAVSRIKVIGLKRFANFIHVAYTKTPWKCVRKRLIQRANKLININVLVCVASKKTNVFEPKFFCVISH